MGGSQYQAKVLIDYLLAEAFDVEIYYLAVKVSPTHEPEGYEIVQFSQGPQRYGQFLDAFRLYDALSRLRPDIVYQQVGCAYTGIAAYYARRTGARMVWRVSSDRSVSPPHIEWWRLHKHVDQKFLEFGIRRADLILAQTRTQQAQLAANYGRSDVVVVPNVHPRPARSGDRKERALKQVVWIANLKPLKNPAAFVRLALKFVSRKDVRFVMVGEEMLPRRGREEVMRLVASAPNLDYVGGRTQEEVNALLEESHVLVNTSDYEGFSNTFIQAWMRHVPVISLNVDPDLLLSEGRLGRLARDETRLAREVERLLDDDELREALGRQCHVYAMQNHSDEKLEHVARLLRLERSDERRGPGRVETLLPKGSTVQRRQAGRGLAPSGAHD
jgi:glycosyltransferase involved in cell wall biosynthesis